VSIDESLPPKKYDPVTGDDEIDLSSLVPSVGLPKGAHERVHGEVVDEDDEEDDEEDDGFNDDGFDTDDVGAYEDQREGLLYMLSAKQSSGRLWQEISSTLQSLTVAMQAGNHGCLVRTISWIRSHNDDEDVEWIFHDTSTWLPGVTLADLKVEPS